MLPERVNETSHFYSIGKYKSNLQCNLQCKNISKCNEKYPDYNPKDPSVAGRIFQYRKVESHKGNKNNIGSDAVCSNFSKPKTCIDGSIKNYVVKVPNYDSITGEYTSDIIYDDITEIDSSCTTE